MRLLSVANALALVAATLLALVTYQPAAASVVANTATCTSTVGPGIPPPTSLPAGIPGFHATWYGQSGYMSLCPGDTSVATVAYYNTGSNGWVNGRAGQTAFLGTNGPEPGADQASVLGGDGTNGTAMTQWPRYNRVAVQPADYVGPNQVSWFQFGIRAPLTPGTYDLYIRPLIEGAQWMEDFGIFWRITVPAAAPVGAPAKLGCTASPTSLVAGSTQTSTITVTVQDANGQTVTTDSGRNITLSQAGTTGSLDGGTTGNSSTKATVNGVATFILSAPPAGVTGTDQLSAASVNLTGCITNVTFATAGAASRVDVALSQSEFPAGSPKSATVTATLKDSSGAVATATTAQTVTFSVDNTSICTVSPGQATIPQGSSSTTTTLTTTGAPGSCTVTASVPGLASGSATASVLAAGPAAKLAITGNSCVNTPTASSTPGSTCDVTVQVQDAAGNKVFGPTPVTLEMFIPGTVTHCGATVVSTTPVGGSGNPATATTPSTGTTVTFHIADSVAESCTATATSGSLTPASTTISFTGSGTPTHLSATASPNPIPANGVSTSTITVCVKDASNNTVTTVTDSIDLAFTSSTGGAAHATALQTSSPQVTSGGCASFVVQSTSNPPATDTYTATDLSRAITSATVTVTTQ